MNLNNQLNLPSYSEILLNTPAPNVPVEGYLNIKQSQEQINLLRMILNSVNDGVDKENISKILILICFIVYYEYFTIHFCNRDGLPYRLTKDLFYIYVWFFVIILGIFATNIYNLIKS